jgi:uncharacterized protein YndB with AHSA1/START domain
MSTKRMEARREEMTDRIAKSVTLQAPRARVWRALTNPAEFGAWFGVTLDATPFTPGARITGRITIPGYEHVQLEMIIERVDPQHSFSYRWHPYAVEPGVDGWAEQLKNIERHVAA